MISKNNDFFHFDKHKHGFEDFSRQDGVGIRYWRARDFMKMLGYDDYPFFNAIIQQSCNLCIGLGIDGKRNFQALSCSRDFSDYRLSKFACYLVAMNCDVNRKEVERAQAYFIAIAESFYRYVCEQEPKIIDTNKNREFDQEASQNICLERAPRDLLLAKQMSGVNWPEGGRSEDKNSGAEPTLSKTDSSGSLCITGKVNYQFFKNKKNLALFNMSYFAERGIRFGEY